MAENVKDDSPKDICFESIVVDLSCHPSRDVIAAGDIDGDVTVHSYSTTEDNHLLLTLPHHKKAVRAVRFSPSGSRLLTGSKDRSIQAIDMAEGKVVKKLDKAHDSPLYCLLAVDDNIIVSGDDDGFLKVWDLRQSKCVMEVQECEEFISDMAIDSRNRVLLATSGDGTLTAYDIRHHKLKLKSENFDAELLSLGIIKEQKKVVCGSGDGVLNIFNWNEWGNISDRFPGHPMSIDCILPVTSDIILTGSIDGYIRAVNILPNRLLGLVGEHENFPVENMTASHCHKYVASCSHDQKIKFWNIENIGKEEIDAQEKPKRTFKKPGGRTGNDFFSDLSGAAAAKDDDVSDDSDDESSSGDDADDVAQSSVGKVSAGGDSTSKTDDSSKPEVNSNSDDDNDDDDDSSSDDDEPT